MIRTKRCFPSWILAMAAALLGVLLLGHAAHAQGGYPLNTLSWNMTGYPLNTLVPYPLNTLVLYRLHEGIVRAYRLRVRQTPGGAVIGWLAHDTAVSIAPYDDAWAQLLDGPYAGAYVARRYLQEVR